jgi:hypothetical protein
MESSNIISCHLMGGLGNQLFQIFTTLRYAKVNNKRFIFTDKIKLGINSSSTIRKTYWTSFLEQLRCHTIALDNISFPTIYKEPEFKYRDICFDSNINNINNKSNKSNVLFILLDFFFQ